MRLRGNSRSVIHLPSCFKLHSLAEPHRSVTLHWLVSHRLVQPYSTVQCFLTLSTSHFYLPASVTHFFWLNKDMCWWNGLGCWVHSKQHCNIIIIMMPGGVKFTSVIFKVFFSESSQLLRPLHPQRMTPVQLHIIWPDFLPHRMMKQHRLWSRQNCNFLLYAFTFFPPHIYFTHFWCEYKITHLNFLLCWGFCLILVCTLLCLPHLLWRFTFK